MAQAFTPGLQVTRSTVVQKIRELPVLGEVLVSVGDQVNASDIVMRANLPGDLPILRIPESMGIEAHEVVEGLLIAEGDQVDEGQVLCQHTGLFGLFKTRFTAPANGTIEFIAQKTGHVGLRLAPTPITVNAYIDGRVIEVEPEKSVTIESNAAFVQGIFGVGGERRGRLTLLDVERDKFLTEQLIPDDCNGKVLVGATMPTFEALQKASAAGARGLITGAIDDQALAKYLGYDLGIALTGDEDISMTIVVTEGFGNIPISERIINTLKEFDGSEASINGATQVRAGALRPEIIVSHQSKANDQYEEHEVATSGLDIGSKIRLIRVPYFGRLGVVRELPHDAQTIETGAVTRVLMAELENGEVVKVPRANVEIIE